MWTESACSTEVYCKNALEPRKQRTQTMSSIEEEGKSSTKNHPNRDTEHIGHDQKRVQESALPASSRWALSVNAAREHRQKRQHRGRRRQRKREKAPQVAQWKKNTLSLNTLFVAWVQQVRGNARCSNESDETIAFGDWAMSSRESSTACAEPLVAQRPVEQYDVNSKQ